MDYCVCVLTGCAVLRLFTVHAVWPYCFCLWLFIVHTFESLVFGVLIVHSPFLDFCLILFRLNCLVAFGWLLLKLLIYWIVLIDGVSLLWYFTLFGLYFVWICVFLFVVCFVLFVDLFSCLICWLIVFVFLVLMFCTLWVGFWWFVAFKVGCYLGRGVLVVFVNSFRCLWVDFVFCFCCLLTPVGAF